MTIILTVQSVFYHCSVAFIYEFYSSTERSDRIDFLTFKLVLVMSRWDCYIVANLKCIIFIFCFMVHYVIFAVIVGNGVHVEDVRDDTVNVDISHQT